MITRTTTSGPPLLTLRIDWSELDLYGHVNNLAFMKYVQASRIHYTEVLGIAAWFTTEKKGFLLASSAIQFKQPLYYPGQVHIQANITFIKNSSFGIRHQLFNEDNDLVATAEDVLVLYDYNSGTKLLFPADLRKKVAQLENSTF